MEEEELDPPLVFDADPVEVAEPVMDGVADPVAAARVGTKLEIAVDGIGSEV